MALNKEGSREQGKRNLGAGSTEIWEKMEKGERSSKKLGNGVRSKRNYQGARGKTKNEQGAIREMEKEQ